MKMNHLIFIFIQQKTLTSTGGEMNAVFRFFSVGVQTPTEIAELNLRTPRPVAIYLCEREATATHD
ncbi:hypothetical protein [Lysinibacillus sp. NPDC047702]|uniref:hypothetical protein n=1 Tax=unclassified Lysinibacillus TaxID=2636778 RepID=UPI003D01E0F7